jgi:hypothetical protein
MGTETCRSLCASIDSPWWPNVPHFVCLNWFTWAAKPTAVCVYERFYLGGQTYCSLFAWKDFTWAAKPTAVCVHEMILLGRPKIQQFVSILIYLGGQTYSNLCAWTDLIGRPNVQQFVCMKRFYLGGQTYSS